MGTSATFIRYRNGYGTADHTLYPQIKHEHNPVYGAQNKASCKKYNVEFSGDLCNPLAAVGHNKVFKGPNVRLWIGCHGVLKKYRVPYLITDLINFLSVMKINGPTYIKQKN